MSMVLIEFTRVWGHPTKWEIYSKGERYWVTEGQAETLIRGNYAKEIERRTGRVQSQGRSLQ